MTYRLSRLLSAATASYGVYALAQPRHLGNAVDPKHADDFDLLATTYGARDLAISSVGMFARSEKAVGAAMVVRILCDVSDGVILAAKAHDDTTRQKVLGVTLGWASLNAAALAVDRRRARARKTL